MGDYYVDEPAYNTLGGGEFYNPTGGVDSGLVAQWQVPAGLGRAMAEGVAEAAGESFREWLTDRSHEDQTASRFRPKASPIVFSDWFVTRQANGMTWTDNDGDGAFNKLYWTDPYGGDDIADFVWNEKEDRWEKIPVSVEAAGE